MKQSNGFPGRKTGKEVVNDASTIKPSTDDPKKSSKFKHLLDPVILKCLAISSLLWWVFVEMCWFSTIKIYSITEHVINSFEIGFNYLHFYLFLVIWD